MTPEDKINSIISEKLGVELDEIDPDASFIDDLGADSLDIVELIMSLEEELDIEIDDDDAEKLTTVQFVYNFIKSKVGEEKWNSYDG
jgi:acyl carrier protein